MGRYLSEKETQEVLGEIEFGGLSVPAILSLIAGRRFPKSETQRTNFVTMGSITRLTTSERELLHEALALKSLREFLSWFRRQTDPLLQEKITSIEHALDERDFRAVFRLQDFYELLDERNRPELERSLEKTWNKQIGTRKGAEITNSKKDRSRGLRIVALSKTLKSQYPTFSNSRIKKMVAEKCGVTPQAVAYQMKRTAKTE